MSSNAKRWPYLLLGASVALVLTAAACSTAESTTEGLATLESESDASLDQAADAATLEDAATLGDAAAADADLSPDEAALAFSQCMRDEGLDFPDLSVAADGNIELREAFQSVDRNAEGFSDAIGVCNPLLGSTAFGGQRAALESPDLQDGLLAFSECVRDAGYDVGDLTLGGQGGGGQGGDNGQPAGSDTDGDGDGPRRQDGFGNRAGRFAENLGLNYEDPAVMETIDGCMPIIDEAFSSAGIGQPAGGNNTDSDTDDGGNDGDN